MKAKASDSVVPKKHAAKDPLPPAATSELPSLGGPSSLGGLPSLGGGARKPFGLGGVGSRGGAFDLDPEALKRANAELAKLNRIGEPDFEEEKKEEVADDRTMLQVMQDKRKAQEAANAAAAAS